MIRLAPITDVLPPGSGPAIAHVIGAALPRRFYSGIDVFATMAMRPLIPAGLRVNRGGGITRAAALRRTTTMPASIRSPRW